jgi:hypothetical protein
MLVTSSEFKDSFWNRKNMTSHISCVRRHHYQTDVLLYNILWTDRLYVNVHLEQKSLYWRPNWIYKVFSYKIVDSKCRPYTGYAFCSIKYPRSRQRNISTCQVLTDIITDEAQVSASTHVLSANVKDQRNLAPNLSTKWISNIGTLRALHFHVQVVQIFWHCIRSNSSLICRDINFIKYIVAKQCYSCNRPWTLIEL